MKTFTKYRKTILWISAVLSGLLLAHLAGAYIYSDGKYIGLPGGSVSVGVVSSSRPQPLNPLLYGSGDIDDMIYNLLFRSLIRYNPETEIFEWDLAYCDISDIAKIQCKLTEDAIWSDGTEITHDDIVATFNIFKEQAKNISVKNALSRATVTTDSENNIIIESSVKNYDIIEALSYPILRSDVVDQIKNNRLKKESYITSGPFIFGEAVDDTEYNYHNIVLEKNPNYKKTVWLDRLRVRIFSDSAALQKWINTVEIIIPSSQQITLPKSYNPVSYSRYEYFGNFFQTNRIDPNLRAIILSHLALRFKESGPRITKYTPVYSLFLNGNEITGKKNTQMDLPTFMSEKGFQKKSAWLSQTHATQTTLTTGTTVPKLKYFRNGNSASILYSDDPKWELSLHGRIPSTTTSVTINNYTLKEYSTGNTEFVYKISTDAGTLKNGKNTYTLKLAQQDGSTLTEILTIYHTLDAEVMQTYKNEVEWQLLAELNTPEKIAERETAKAQKITEIEALADNTYYNDKYEPFTLKLAFISDNEASTRYAEFTMQEISELGITVEWIAMTTKELDAMIKSGEKNYDMIIVGIQSPGTVADMGSSFFSSTNGNPNFANISSKNFVSDFEALKNVSDENKANEAENKIINFMNEHNFYLPISQPEHIIYVHGDVKWLTIPKIVGNTASLANTFSIISKKEEYKLAGNKSISGFISWLSELYTPSQK